MEGGGEVRRLRVNTGEGWKENVLVLMNPFLNLVSF